MRRSNSASRLPIKKDLFGSGRRSSSTDRNSRPSAYLSVPKTSVGGSKFSTPVCRTNSTGRLTRSPFDNRNADKKKIQQQYELIREFLVREMPNSEEVVSNLNNPSIRLFIEVISFLLKQIDEKVVINNENFKTMVPEKLKLLDYPGPLSASLFKAISTHHTWPQVLGIFAWLIDIIRKFIRPPVEHTLDNLHSKFFTSYYIALNNGESLPDTVEQFRRDIFEYYGIDREAAELKKAELIRLEAVKKQQLVAIQKLVEENEELATINEDLLKKLKELERNHFSSETDLELRIEQLENEKQALDEQIKGAEEEENQLKVNVESNGREKEKLLNEVSYLERAIDVKKKHVQNIGKMRSEFEIEFSLVKQDIDAEINRLNEELLPHMVIKKELRVLELTPFKFPDIEEKARDFMEKKKVMEDEIRSEVKELMNELAEKEKERKSIQTQLSNTDKVVEKLEQSFKELKHKTDLANERFLMLFAELKNNFKFMENSRLQIIKLETTDDAEFALQFAKKHCEEKQAELNEWRVHFFNEFTENNKKLKRNTDAAINFHNEYFTVLDSLMEKATSGQEKLLKELNVSS